MAEAARLIEHVGLIDGGHATLPDLAFNLIAIGEGCNQAGEVGAHRLAACIFVLTSLAKLRTTIAC